MKKNNILIIVLIGLVLLFVATNYFKKNSNTNFKSEVIQLDSSMVNKIVIRSSLVTEEEPIIISKDNDSWLVEQGTVKTKANQSTVKNTLGQLEEMKTERLVAKSKDKWKAYALTDSLAQCVEIHQQGKEQITKLYFGKTTYKQSQNPGYGGRPSVDASTYFRIDKNPKTYATKSGLANTFKRNFNTWRNTEFIKVDKDLITQLKFETEDNSGFSLSKNESVWTMGNLTPDSTKVAQYLNTLRHQNSSKFANEFTPKSKADYKLTIQGNSIEDLVVKAYRDSIKNKFFLNSSQHPNVFVESDSTGLFKQLFVSQDHF
ncbi:DUF4340 domain-containing protein [Cognatitamlana onchidii]|uniref:DUF4340 domain-containing protein n=1 Tax=Cognatitamlana onchidii TaxID=2562860 RepID=UPI0010A5F627|nr:DUF4340 domain-containing protein [Algibacter onchidii]